MILKSFRTFFILLFFSLSFSSLYGEEEIDIWKNKKIQNNSSDEKKILNNEEKTLSPIIEKIKEPNSNVAIESSLIKENEKINIFGVYDPADYNFNLNMWSSTNADDIRAIMTRLKKIKLSDTSNEILEKTLLSFSFPPEGMKTEEFVKLKIDWLLDNNRIQLIEKFLKQNKEFEGKQKAVQYLVDQNISQANIKEGCEKIKFIDSTIKDPYLEKFKIYCLVFNNKKSEAQLLLDLLREQNQSDKFFDDKINFLLNISDKTSNKINEKNLLNFYLSSITIKDFKYNPNKNTKKEIWKYLNSANLIILEDVEDEKKIKDLELAANQGQVDPETIFNIYKQFPFNLNTLINAQNLYQTLQTYEARALIFQKFLLSEDNKSKVEYLFILENLFKKDKLGNIYSNFLSNKLKDIGLENIPKNFQEIAEKKILYEKKNNLTKTKYNDKILHQSKIIKFYLESENQKKVQKDIDKIIKKIYKNKKYFFSAKDLALIDSLVKDGFKIPPNFNYKELSEKYEIPKNLLQLINKNQSAFLALKIVEIIGEDEPYQLDPETIYFITSLLNQTDLIKIRNKILISALPQRA